MKKSDCCFTGQAAIEVSNAASQLLLQRRQGGVLGGHGRGGVVGHAVALDDGLAERAELREERQERLV